jgi:hypothetical protein
MTFPASNFAVSGTSGQIRFQATSTGKTFTSNGVSLGAIGLSFEGAGGGWTLGSALTATTGSLSISQGSFSTANFSVTCATISSLYDLPVSISLGSSIVTLSSSLNFYNTTNNIVLTAGTSSIVMTAAGPSFNGGGLTFYNVSFTSTAAGTVIIYGNNTFNNLSVTSRSTTGVKAVSLSDFSVVNGPQRNQTINGLLTLGEANTTSRRVQVVSGATGTQATVTLNGTLATLTDCDFRDIAVAGSYGTWTGTRLGNGLANSGITFDAAKTVYWNFTAGGSWSQTVWATSSGGTPAVNNFPLAQDTVIIENTGLNTSATITIDITGVWIGELNASGRSLAMTLANGTSTARIYKNIALSSSVTQTGTGTWTMSGQGTVQTLTIARAFILNFSIDSPGGTFRLISNTAFSGGVTTQNMQLVRGTLDLNNFTLTCNRFYSFTPNVRSITFGTGVINLSGTIGTVFSYNDNTNLICTGSKNVNLTYSGAPIGLRLVQGPFDYLPENFANLLNLNIAGGATSNVDVSGFWANVDTTGFAAQLFFSQGVSIAGGNLILSSDLTLVDTGYLSFYGLGGTQQITTNGQVFLDWSIDCSEVIENNNSIFAFQDALTMTDSGALISTFVLYGGTLQFKAGTVNTVDNFITNNYPVPTAQRYLQSTTPGVQATLVQSSGTVDATYLSIRDSNATGGASFNATAATNVNAGNNTGWLFATPPPPVIIGSGFTIGPGFTLGF